MAFLLFPALACQFVLGQASPPGEGDFDATLRKDKATVLLMLKDENMGFAEYDANRTRGYHGHFPIRDEDKAKVYPVDQENMFENYYRKYALARWSQSAGTHDLPVFRKELRTELLSAKAVNSHTKLTELALDSLKKMVGSDSPVVRVNAILMLGELNSVEPPRPIEDPVPLKEVLDPLLGVVTSKEQSDAAKVAAMVGLVRHVKLGIADDEKRQQIAKAMVELVATPPPAMPPVDGDAWLKSQAIEILGAIGDAGENNAVAILLGKTAADATVALPTRRAAARALGRISYKAGVDATALASAVGKMAVAACRRAKTDAEAKRAGCGRQLKSFIGAAWLGLKGKDQQSGIEGAAKGTPHETFVKGVSDQVGQIMKLVDVKDPSADAVLQTETIANELNTIVEKSG
jgi:hypothetical protein